jgi:hypothetical protein
MLRYQLISSVTRKRSLDAIKGVVIDYRIMLTVINGILMFDLANEHGVLEQEPKRPFAKADIADGSA